MREPKHAILANFLSPYISLLYFNKDRWEAERHILMTAECYMDVLQYEYLERIIIQVIFKVTLWVNK